jgi:diaminopimelate decarboxylase
MTHIDKIKIEELAENYGTPLYAYDKNKIIENYYKLVSSFRTYYNNVNIHYSVKANSNPAILKIFGELGSGVDCSSPIEIELARLAGFSNREILYTGNYESHDDLLTASADGIRINLDDINSLYRLLKIKTPEIISFRINPGIGRGGFEGIVTAGSDAKFGVPYEKAMIAYKTAMDAGIKRFGIQMMTGSNNLEPYYFAEIVDKLMNIAGNVFNILNIIPEYIDIGGGFGIPYSEGEEPLNTDMTAQLVCGLFVEKCLKYGFGSPELLLEPGRFLVANAGFLITKVTGLKDSYKKFAGVDAGMNTLLRPALYGAYHRFVAAKQSDKQHHINICGQICENSDILASNIQIAELNEGDLIVIRDCGAYGFSMSSNYNNRPRAAEVLIDGDKSKLIRKRESLEDMIRLCEI